jgi:hypothetical protein
MWKPGLIEESLDSITRMSRNATIIHKFNMKDGDVWYVRFCLDSTQQV